MRIAFALDALDALDYALFDRQPERNDCLIHPFDRGLQYVSIRYSERLAEAGIEPPVGSPVAIATTTRWLKSLTCCTKLS